MGMMLRRHRLEVRLERSGEGGKSVVSQPKPPAPTASNEAPVDMSKQKVKKPNPVDKEAKAQVTASTVPPSDSPEV